MTSLKKAVQFIVPLTHNPIQCNLYPAQPVLLRQWLAVLLSPNEGQQGQGIFVHRTAGHQVVS